MFYSILYRKIHSRNTLQWAHGIFQQIVHKERKANCTVGLQGVCRMGRVKENPAYVLVGNGGSRALSGVAASAASLG